MVQHLEETDIDGGAGDIKDSTLNANNGTTVGMDTSDQAAGQIDGSFDFDGVDDYVSSNMTIGEEVCMPVPATRSGAGENVKTRIKGGVRFKGGSRF